MISPVQQMHAALNRADREESTVCKHCEQLVAASAYSPSPGPVCLDHYSSILSLRQSSEHCPLCRQLLEWIDKDTLSDCTTLENHGCSTIIQFIRVKERGAADAQLFQGISHWIFSLNTSKKFPMEREVWRPTLKHSSGTGIHLVVAHDRG
jgi:hypothetical protein